MGLISKNCTGARRTALNMLSCRFWAELTRTLKKSKLRRKPNTTEVAVKPDKSTEKKKIHQHTTMLSLCFMFQGQLCISGVFIKHAEWYTKGDTFHFSFPFSYVFFFCLERWYITVNTKPEWVKRLGVTGRKSEQSNSRELERHCYLPVQLRPMYTYTEPWRPWATAKELWICSLNGWRIQSLDSTQKAMCARRASPA